MELNALIWAIEKLAVRSAVSQAFPMFTSSKLARTTCDAPGFSLETKPMLIERHIDSSQHIILAPLPRRPNSPLNSYNKKEDDSDSVSNAERIFSMNSGYSDTEASSVSALI